MDYYAANGSIIGKIILETIEHNHVNSIQYSTT